MCDIYNQPYISKCVVPSVIGSYLQVLGGNQGHCQ